MAQVAAEDGRLELAQPHGCPSRTCWKDLGRVALEAPSHGTSARALCGPDVPASKHLNGVHLQRAACRAGKIYTQLKFDVSRQRYGLAAVPRLASNRMLLSASFFCIFCSRQTKSIGAPFRDGRWRRASLSVRYSWPLRNRLLVILYRFGEGGCYPVQIWRRTAKESLFAKHVGQWLDASGKCGA